MAGVAFVVDLPIQIIRCRAAIGGSAFAPAVVGQFFFEIATAVADADDAAQSVVVAPVEFAGVATRLVDLNTEPIRPVGFDGRLTIIDFSLLRSGIVGGGDSRIAVGLAGFDVFASLVFRPIGELAAVGLAFADAFWHVEAGPVNVDPATAADGAQQVAVVVVFMRADPGDLLDGMGAHAIAAGGGVDVVAHADTGFTEDVANGVVAEVLAGLAVDGGAFEPVGFVVCKAFAVSTVAPILAATIYIA